MSDQQLSNLMTKTVALLLKRIEDGSATAADLSVARNLLRDNGITATPEACPDMLGTAKALRDLPFANSERE